MRARLLVALVTVVGCTATPNHPPILGSTPDATAQDATVDSDAAADAPSGSDGAVDADSGVVVPPWDTDASSFAPWAEIRQPNLFGAVMGPSGDVFDFGSISGAGYLHRHDFGGSSRFDRTFPKGAGTAYPTAAATLANGHVVLGGTFAGPMDLGAGPTEATNAAGLFLAEFDLTGNVVWSRTFACTGGRVTSIATDPAGAIAFAGEVNGTFALASDAGSLPRTYFVTRLDATRTPTFTHLVSGVFIFEIRSADVAFDSTGALYAVFGRFGAPVDLGTGPVATTGRAILATRMDANGTPKWVRAISTLGTNADFAGFRQSVAVAKSGRLYVATTTEDTLTSECGSIVANGTDVVVAELDATTGSCVRAAVIGGAGLQSLGGLSVDGNGQVFVAGSATSTIDVGGQLTPLAGGADAFVARLDPNLALVGVDVYGDADTQSMVTVHAVGPGYRALTGGTAGTMVIAGKTLNGTGPFVAVLGP